MISLTIRISVALFLIHSLILPTTSFGLEKVHVCVPDAPVYEGPGIDYIKLADLDFGKPVKILGYEKIGEVIWYNIEFPKGNTWEKGWIAGEQISPRRITLEEYSNIITMISEKSMEHSKMALTVIPIILGIAAAAGFGLGFWELKKAKENLNKKLKEHDEKENEYHAKLEDLRNDAKFNIESFRSRFEDFLAYSNWQLKEFRDAIYHGERALEIAIELKMKEGYILAVKNNLAYYYAKAKDRTTSERDRAIEYAQLLKEKHSVYKENTWLTTWAMVKIIEAEEFKNLELIEEVIEELKKYKKIKTYGDIRDQVTEKLATAKKVQGKLKKKTPLKGKKGR